MLTTGVSCALGAAVYCRSYGTFQVFMQFQYSYICEGNSSEVVSLIAFMLGRIISHDAEFLKSVGFVGLADKNMLSLTKIDSLSIRRTGKEFP
jgi:hypothetical protein